MLPPHSARPAITVHSAAHVRAALEPGRPVLLLSAPGAAVYAGPEWWRAMIDGCGTGEPDLLDCADAAGRALEAIALGCRRIVLWPCPAWDGVAERAGRAGTTVLPARPPSLDLAERGAARRIAAWLQTG